jgi:uncharacterized protein YjgD (DUF1641 family)
VAPTGSDEPFTYSIETHYGASDHEVFNDWGVQVPGVMMIAWPDQWYHTSGDHVDKSDPTQLKRIAVIGAASAYTIASADDDMAIRIAGEIVSNATRRVGHQTVRGLEELNSATKETLAEAYKNARVYIESAARNEKSTLETITQLAKDNKTVGSYIATSKETVDQLAKVELGQLEQHMKAVALKLHVDPAKIQLTDLEKKAKAIVPRPTEKVKANGYGGYREFLPRPQGGRGQRGEGVRIDRAEMQLLINGRNTLLDIKNMMDAQAERKADLQEMMNYLDVLRTAGLVEVN